MVHNKANRIPLSILSSLEIRVARRDEIPRWHKLMSKYHYLGFNRIVGSSIYYVVTRGRQWVALLGWGSAALKCAPRDRWIGWDKHQQYSRLHFIANNLHSRTHNLDNYKVLLIQRF